MSKKAPIPVNSIFVTVTKPVADIIKTNGGLELYLDSKWHHEQHVSCTGKVASLPKDNPFEGQLQEGDEVCFSYQVIATRRFDADGHMFNPYIDEPYRKQFYDGQMNKIDVCAYKGSFGVIKYACSYVDKRGVFIDGAVGTQSVMERWLSQFQFGNTQSFIFSHLIDYENQHYWKCNYSHIFAKKVKGKLQAIGDRVILKPIDVLVPKHVFTEMGLEIPKSAVYNREIGKAEVVSGGKSLGLKKGDIVGFDDQYKEKYTYFDKDYYLLTESRITEIYE